MGLLAKVSPALAGVDTLLYAVPAGKKASLTINVANRSQFAVDVDLAVMSATDVSLNSAAVVTKGSGYTSIPQITVAGENTSPAGVVVDTMAVASSPINTAGEGYAVDDVLTLNVTGATAISPSKVKVLSVSATGGITSVEIDDAGSYSAIGSAASVSGGAGTGASFSALTWGIDTVHVVTKGNGYKSNPSLTAAGGNGATFSTQMTRIVEDDDYFELGVGISKGSPLERTGIVLSEGQSLYIRAAEGSLINAHVWGFETLA